VRFWQKQQLVIVIIAVVAISWFVFVSYMPLRQSEIETQEAQQIFTANRIKSNSELRQLPQLKSQLEQIETTVAGYEARIPSSTQLGTFLQQVADVMNTCNLKGHLIEPGAETATNRLSCIPVNIKCTGTLKQIFEFFKSLEQFDRAIRIEEVQLSNDGDFTEEVRMHTKIYIYYTSASERAV
jgi:Tfp pilus assembly protein PilO